MLFMLCICIAFYVTKKTHNSLLDFSLDFFHPGHKEAYPREHSRSVPVAQIFSISLGNVQSSVRYLR